MAFLIMMMTNWMALSYSKWSAGTPEEPETNESALWVQLVLSWLAAGLYVWSLFAPRVCGDGQDV